jgi:hypothetical protein
VVAVRLYLCVSCLDFANVTTLRCRYGSGHDPLGTPAWMMDTRICANLLLIYYRVYYAAEIGSLLLSTLPNETNPMPILNACSKGMDAAI